MLHFLSLSEYWFVCPPTHGMFVLYMVFDSVGKVYMVDGRSLSSFKYDNAFFIMNNTAMLYNLVAKGLASSFIIGAMHYMMHFPFTGIVYEDKEDYKSPIYEKNIVWLGPHLSSRPKAWFGPKHNNKIGLHTHHHHPPHKLFNQFQGRWEVESQHVVIV